MDARRFELITFAAAHELRHTACSLAHGHALSRFILEDGVRKLALGEASDAVTAAESAMMDFARKVASDASRITSGDVDMLRSHGFSDEEVFDIAATAAGRAFFTKLLDALGVMADGNPGSMSRELRETLTVGRPIDFRPPETMPAGETADR